MLMLHMRLLTLAFTGECARDSAHNNFHRSLTVRSEQWRDNGASRSKW
jgi:hypothetical protein